jgi:pimeloyl-ACP methyl ester carboxylesterase
MLRGRLAVLSACVTAAVLLTIPAAAGITPVAKPPHDGGGGTGPIMVNYRSSVDGFPLSFEEWLPSGYMASHAYPLTVFLHGMGTGTAAVRGGVGATSIPSDIVRGAAEFGSILISLNTRSEAGFYANTACGGPQEQDVLDAITLEESDRNVSSVYLVGFSMGSIGAFRIAADHPKLISGIAVAGTITDLFEVYAYDASLRAAPTTVISDLCGVFPSATNTSAVQFFESESPARFSPQNFSEMRIYVTAGGEDVRAANNFSVWPYAQVNSTFVNSSCQVVSSLDEPASCTTPFSSLARSHPGDYVFRYVYEPTAPHDSLQLNGTDMFEFLFGMLPPGFYTAGFPPVDIDPVSLPVRTVDD